MTTSTQKRMIKHINQTVFELLNDYHFDEITVQKICDAAEINRSTFYRYFQDKYDLLYSLTEYMKEALDLDSLHQHVSTDALESFISFINTHKPVFKHLLVASRQDDVFRSLTQFCSEKILEGAECNNDLLAHKIMNSDHPQLIADFYSSGLIEIIRRWVENNYSYSEEEILSALHDTLDFSRPVDHISTN